MQTDRASKKQQEVLGFVDGFIKTNGYGPSYREIMSALGYKSVSTVAIHIDSLISKGFLARRDNSARSLEVLSMQGAALNSNIGSTQLDIETELIKQVVSLSITDEQADTVRQSFEILGYEKAAAAIRDEAQDEPKST